MTCDDAFDCLTDPHRRDDALLWQHLEHCPRCRAMHETLTPAIGLFHSVANVAVSVEPVAEVARTAARQLTQRHFVQERIAGASRRARCCFAASIALAGVACAAVGLNPSKQVQPSAATGEAQDCLWLARNLEANSLTPLQLAATCAACHTPAAPLHPRAL